jgi:hypothetical protein
MTKVPLTVDKRTRFQWKAGLILAACAVALLASPLRGQDDNDGAPPPPVNAPPDQDDTGQAPAQGDGSGAPNDSSASFQTFYDNLADQGTWIQSSDYGYVWQPTITDADWAPYTEGHWVYTDYGWTWVSDEPWGWATYHYGRWANIGGLGWVWVPGYTWAPAWVSWRYGGGYCGWAPLPPDSFVGVDYFGDGFSIGIGFHIGGDCDGFYGIGAGWYNFLPVNALGYRSYHGYYRNRNDNFALINHTTNVTNINVTRNGAGSAAGFGRVTTGGPSLAMVNAVSQTPIQRVSLVGSSQPGGGGRLSGNSLAFYAPRVRPATSAVLPARVGESIGPATINRGIDITQPLAVNSRLAPAQPTEAQLEQARIAQDHAPANAKVVTDVDSVRPVLHAPLTSLKPVVEQPSPSRIFNTTPSSPFNTERTPSTVRTYPQTSENGAPSRVYSPAPAYSSGSSPTPSHPVYSNGGGSESHPYVERPASPGYSPPAQQSQHSSGGGYSGGGGHPQPSGGPGGNYQQNH